MPSEEVFSITGDEAGNLWLSGNRGLTHLRSARIVEHFPWSAVRRTQQAKVVLSDKGGVWLSFWIDGALGYFKDGQLRASFGVADGLGKGVVPGIQLDEDGALWAATEDGISRIKDGHVATLTSANGLPCDTIHGTMWDDSGALWASAQIDAIESLSVDSFKCLVVSRIGALSVEGDRILASAEVQDRRSVHGRVERVP